jgi:hypothetical protein
MKRVPPTISTRSRIPTTPTPPPEHWNQFGDPPKTLSDLLALCRLRIEARPWADALAPRRDPDGARA